MKFGLRLNPKDHAMLPLGVFWALLIGVGLAVGLSTGRGLLGAGVGFVVGFLGFALAATLGEPE
jgi:hypothetical protein